MFMICLSMRTHTSVRFWLWVRSSMEFCRALSTALRKLVTASGVPGSGHTASTLPSCQDRRRRPSSTAAAKARELLDWVWVLDVENYVVGLGFLSSFNSIALV